MMSASTNPKDYICEICGLGYGSRQNLWRHKNTKHKDDEETERRAEKRKTTNCGLCDLLLVNQYDLCEHLRLSHGLDAAISTKEFDNVDSFSEWRKEQERNGLFRFTKSCGDASDHDSGNTRQYFYCHRSGEYESKVSGQKSKRPRNTDSVRTGFRCSAFAFCKIGSTGRVVVSYCLDHYKHDSLLGRLPLPEDVVVRVGIYLKEKRDFEWILDHIRSESDESGAISRQQLITRHDLTNIQRRLGLREAEKCHNDMDSVATWITEYEAKRDEDGDLVQSPFFCYNPLVEQNGIFTLGIQTEFQMEMMRSFSSTAICIDATHKITMYAGYLLVTVLVLDHNAKGYPVAWFIVSNETEEVLKICFGALRERIGQINTKFFMSDDADQYWNAWEATFGGTFPRETKKLLCTWHVLNNWRKQLKKKVPSAENQLWIWHHLGVLIREGNEAKFRNLLAVFQHQLGTHEGCEAFDKYFKDIYCKSEERIMEWSLWARRGSSVNTNMYLESFHRILKGKFLKGRQNRRMDCLMYTLLTAARWFLQEYAITKERGCPADNYRLRVMHRRNENSLKLDPNGVRYNDEIGVWFVRSETDANLEYEVERAMVSCDCGLKCRICGVCPNLYFCTCPDSILTTTACKHMHFVHSLKNQDANSFEVDASETEVTVPEDRPDPREHLVRIHKNRQMDLPERITAVERVLTDCLKSVPMIQNQGAAEKILSKANELSALIKTLSAEQTSITPTADYVGPANKLAERQRRFEPARRKKRARTDGGLPKPTAQQALTVMENMATVLADMRICGLCFSDIDDEDEYWIDCHSCKTLFHEECCAKNWPEYSDADNFVCRACIRLRK